MKQEKLCEAEDMTEKDYSRWYADPMDEKKFKEELGAANNLYIDPKEMERIKQQHIEQFNRQEVERFEQQIREKIRISGDSPEWEKSKVNANNKQVGGDHYKRMGVQPWDVIDYGPKQQAIGFYRYNALKYVMRAGEKGDFKEDIAKAHHYLQKLLEILE